MFDFTRINYATFVNKDGEVEVYQCGLVTDNGKNVSATCISVPADVSVMGILRTAEISPYWLQKGTRIKSPMSGYVYEVEQVEFLNIYGEIGVHIVRVYDNGNVSANSEMYTVTHIKDWENAD